MKNYVLDDVLCFFHGKAIKPSEGDVPIYGSNGIIGKTQKLLYDDAIIIGRVGAYCGSVERCKGGFWASDNTIVAKAKNGFSTDYCFYMLKTMSLNSFAGGSAQPLITQTTLKSLNTKLPCLQAQHRVASVLTSYDKMIENNQKQIKLLEEAAQRLYKEWFVDLRFPGHETTPIADGIPEGWEKAEVGSCISKIARTKQVMTADMLETGTIPVVDQSRSFVAGYTNDTETIVDLGVPVIVFGDHTRVLKYIQFPFAKGADGTQLIVSNNERMPQSLFYCSLVNVDLSNHHYARHFKYLKAEEILFPTMEIACRFDGMVAPLFKQIQLLRDKCTLAAEARDRLLPKLMNGEIEV